MCSGNSARGVVSRRRPQCGLLFIAETCCNYINQRIVVEWWQTAKAEGQKMVNRLHKCQEVLYVLVTVHRDKFRIKQPTRCIKYKKFILS